MKKSLTLIALAIFSFSCSDSVSSTEETKNPIEEPSSVSETQENYSSNRANQDPINIVYFVPADVDVPNDRILENYGKSVIFAQDWYEKQMEHYGYGSKTFALFTNNDNTRAKVLVVNGQENASYYNLGSIRTEVEAYFAAHSNEIGSNDAIVATDEELGYSVAQTGKNYIDGRYGFVRSTDNWNLVDSGKDFDGLDILTCGRIQSVMHEGGHVFGVPHYAHKNSDSPNRSVMGGGAGSSFWHAGNEDKVFLTAEGAAICNTSRAFNPTNNGIDYYDVNPTFNIISYDISKNATTEATEYDVVFKSDIVPTYAYVLYRDNVNSNGYDNVPFGTKTITSTGNPNEYSIHIEAPYSDYFNGFKDSAKTHITLQLNIITENGVRTNILNHDYTITTAPTPDNNINTSYTEPYCEASGGSSSGSAFITGVSISDLDITLTKGTFPYYHDNTTDIANVDSSSSYTLTIDMNQVWGNTKGGTSIYAWVDWNQDMDFDDEGELFVVHPNTPQGEPASNPSYDISLEVPADAVPGNTRMRVGATWNVLSPSPCSTGKNSSWVDVTINVD